VTLDELRRCDRATVTIDEAYPAIGISRGLAYQAARERQLPVLRVGRRLLVLRRPLLEMLGENDEGRPAGGARDETSGDEST
jgi:hypothetical protein